MNFEVISRRTKALQQELETISEHNRKYFARRTHTPVEKAAHNEIQERVIQIRSELANMLQPRVRQQ